jgi:cytochrome bd-type quinol oxidase subunit 2
MNSYRKKDSKFEWLIPAALIILSLVPAIAGSARLVELISGAEITSANARFFDSPLPVVAHIIGATLYSILGAFQFSPNFRRRKTHWHRFIGKWVLVPSGVAVSLSGLWMNQFYNLPEVDGEFLYIQRIFFGSAMFLSVVLGAFAVRRRDYKAHGDWMMRGYAIGLGAGIQVFTHLPWILFLGAPDELTRALLMGAGWVINLAAAEWIIRKPKENQTKTIAYA